MTYGAETRAETVTKRILRTTEMKTLRAIREYILNDRQRNRNIKEMCQTDNVVRWIKKRRKKLNQNVNRINTPHRRRPIERPLKRMQECS